MINLLWLLLPVAAASGWYIARREYQQQVAKQLPAIPQDYFRGLNYLLNEQPDKAIDVFIKMAEVEGETIEVHLALGNLFRQRGEVDRAIRIHQDLINRSTLSGEQQRSVLFELASDYLSAGLLDRAEDLCQELIESDANNLDALQILSEIYQQEREWTQAIDAAHLIERSSGEALNVEIAQFYCELAEEALQKGDISIAEAMLNRAFAEDSACARASIILGGVEQELGNHQAAIRIYQKMEKQAPQYFPEVLEPMQCCFQALGRAPELVVYLKGVLENHHGIEVILMVSRLLQAQESEQAAIGFLEEQVSRWPSLRGLHYLAEMGLGDDSGTGRKNLSVVKSVLDRLLDEKPAYRCNRCGFSGKSMHWHCPGCRSWSSVLPIQELQWSESH